MLGLGNRSLGGPQSRRAVIDACIAHLKYLPLEQRVALSEQVATSAGAVPPSTLMMSSHAVVALHRAGMEIGAHTVTHPILAKLALDEARREIEGSRTRLEALLGDRVGLFAYPNGKPGDDYRAEHVRLVSDFGFDAAVSTHRGVADVRSDLLQLPRFTPWDQTRLRFGARLLINLKQAAPATA
jgi:peptidoglycan/xylan/chitin deacetylase (PgdA/CDA1 family)